MTYRELVQEKRGTITNENSLLDIDSVVDYGTTNLVAFMLDTKTIGFRLGAEIATSLPHPLQKQIVRFMYESKRNVKDIRLELQRLQDGL